MWDPNNPPPPPPSSSSAGATNARYAYLVGRLRARQITMEEATELFGLMQAMMQRSEAGRQALMAASRVRGASPTPSPTSPVAPRAPAAMGVSDDMLLFGLLAMGAGAGLVGALAKRFQNGPAPAATKTSESTAPPR
ncbi:MAG: hypothetical protein L3K10_05735 [Thermoplasmata archaeon]|nr:hypothetical protein [Thermoplasmata archaeon]